MATSNSYDFALTRDNILTLAHQHIGALGEGETLTTAQTTEAALLLNMIVKLRANMGMPVWGLKRGYILPFSGASSIATDSHCVTSYDTTTLSAAALASATTITLTSATGFSNGDQIGVELTNGDMHWTTINGAPSGNNVTLTSGLASAAASGGRVYGYTSSTERISKPLRIIQANRYDVANAVGVPIELLSRVDYYNISNRTNEGQPNSLFYDPGSTSNTNLDNASFFIWPRFADGDSIIEMVYHRQFQDFDGSTDNPDFPQAFYLPLMMELAAILGPKFGVPIDERKALLNEAQGYFSMALETTTQEESVYFEVDRSYGR